MPLNSRRQFLHRAGTAALALPAGVLARHLAYAAPSASAAADKVRVLVDARRTIAPGRGGT